MSIDPGYWRDRLDRFRNDGSCEREILDALEGKTEPGPVDFYEREFYPLSNFSSFEIVWHGLKFSTSEQAYHWMKFPDRADCQMSIRRATSAHEAFKRAEALRSCRRPDWDAVKVDVMRTIIRTKADQHEYVRRKLLETGDRPLIEGSWRDDYWGIGPNGDGQNMLGKLWMELRANLRKQP